MTSLLWFSATTATASQTECGGISPPGWKEPEKWAWQRICSGEDADFNKKLGSSPDPSNAGGWGESRQLSSNFLETILFDRRFKDVIKRRGVRVVGALFRDPVDIEEGVLNKELWLDQSRFEQAANLSGLRTPSVLSLDGSSFSGQLNLDSIDVGRLFMRNSVFGQSVDLSGAKVHGNAVLMKSRFLGEVRMNLAVVSGELVLTSSAFVKSLSLSNASITSDLDLSGAVLGYVELTGAHVGGVLYLYRPGRQPVSWVAPSTLLLRNARSDAFWIEGLPGMKNLELEGFNYGRIKVLGDKSGDDSDYITSTLLAWLNRDSSYSPQPYHHLASTLDKSGDSDIANEIRYANKERQRRLSTGSAWWGLSILSYTIGYGIGNRYFFVLYWIVGIVAVGVLVLHITGEVHRHDIGHGVWYSLDMLLPIVELRPKHDDFDLTEPARTYFYMHKLLGYLLASFLVAGISGVTQ